MDQLDPSVMQDVPSNPVEPPPLPKSEPEPLTVDWLAHHSTGWQFGEEGVIDAMVTCIEKDVPEEHRWCVEFGAGDNATLPLTCMTTMRRPGWRSLLIDGDGEKCDVLRLRVPESAIVVEGMVNTQPGTTIDDYMARAGCPSSPAVMVVDVDSIDYYIVATMEARPYILCVEHMDLECKAYTVDGPFVPRLEDAGKPVGDGFNLQANDKALDATLGQLGYSPLYRTRVNSIYVRNDMVGRVARPRDKKVRINIGAGAHNDPRYTPLDIKTGTDARNLPYESNSVDEVYASHILEHFTFHERDNVLNEWARVLKPDGRMRIAVPDLTKIAKSILENEETNFREVEMVLYGAHSDPNDVHHAAYTERQLRRVMYRAGIGNITRFHPFIRSDCSNHPMSLNLQGRKRWWPKVENPKIVLVLSQPRFAFTGHELRLIELARKLDFETEVSVGAFWDRDMTLTTQRAISKHNPDFLLYSDYDSIFEVDDVKRMLEAIQNNPTMAAIGAVQMSRHNDEPLVFEKALDYSGELTKVNYQHFGLMLVRRPLFDELDTLDQPYFWSIPGRTASGGWDWDQWNRSDADITFWRNLQEMGFNVFQHNGVSIGHISQVVRYPRDKDRGIQAVPIENYWKYGKPASAVFNQNCYKKPKDGA